MKPTALNCGPSQDVRLFISLQYRTLSRDMGPKPRVSEYTRGEAMFLEQNRIHPILQDLSCCFEQFLAALHLALFTVSWHFSTHNPEFCSPSGVRVRSWAKFEHFDKSSILKPNNLQSVNSVKPTSYSPTPKTASRR